MGKQSKFIYFCTSFLFFTFANFYFSNLIIANFLNGAKVSGPILSLKYAENTGAAFSIMQDSKSFLIFLSTAAIFLIFYYVMKNTSKISAKGLFFISLLLSGIVGNLYERIHYGYVRDFFDLTFVNFPIFNISDIFINIGVFGIIILILFSKKSRI